MELLVERVDVWAAGLKDEPGALAGKLAALAEAGADLEFIVARRSSEAPGGVVFVTPLRGDDEVRAAADVGFIVSQHMHSVRVEGDNQRGVCATLTRKIADAKINLRGVSGAVIGRRFIVYLAFETLDDAQRAVGLLQTA